MKKSSGFVFGCSVLAVVLSATVPNIEELQTTMAIETETPTTPVPTTPITSTSAPSTSAPSTACHTNSADFDGCILNKFQTLIPRLDKGIPELSMPAIDPYYFRKGLFRYANDGIEGGLLIRSMNIRGIKNIKVNSIRSNFTDKGYTVAIDAVLPRIIADGNFKADVKFGGLRLIPKGLFNMTINNIKAAIKTGGSFIQTEQGQRLQLNELDAKVELGSTKLVANGIFSDRNLNNMILNLINENLPEITRVGIPATKAQWAPIFIQHINKFFANVPIDALVAQD